MPLCATHHRALHDAGVKKSWWSEQKIDPIAEAELLWRDTRGRKDKMGSINGANVLYTLISGHAGDDQNCSVDVTSSV